MTVTEKVWPKVVALMGTYNAEAFIRPALESLARQSYPNFHVLISDDASTDETAPICEAFAARHDNFHVVRQPQNLGWIGNANYLLATADGDYFCFIDHDDCPRPHYVARLAEALEANPRSVMAIADMVRRIGFDDERPDTPESFTLLEGVTDRAERGVCVARGQSEIPALTTIAMHGLFRVSAARQIGGLRPHLAGEFGADWPWLLRLALMGEIVRVPEPLFEKLYVDTNLSLRWRYSLWQRFCVVLACLQATRSAKLSLREEFRIQRALIYHALQRQWWRINQNRR